MYLPPARVHPHSTTSAGQLQYAKGDYTMKKFFAGINTLDALKAEYKRLVKENHPDLGGDEATMKAINNQYAEAVEYIKLHGEQAARDCAGVQEDWFSRSPPIRCGASEVLRSA